MPRLYAIDALKVLLALGVVWAHAVLLGGHFSEANYLFGQALVRPAVPTFALVSGFLFHFTWRRGTTRRWLAVVGAAYLFWCLVYAPVWLPDTPDLGHALVRLVFGPLHLWYMAALVLAVAMITAILHWTPGGKVTRRWLLGLAIALLLVGNALQAVKFFTPIDVPLNAYRNGVFVEYPYAAFGFLLAGRVAREGRDWMPSAPRLWLLLAGLAGLRLIEAWLSLHAFGLSPAAPPEFPPLAVAFSLTLAMACLRLDLPKLRLPMPAISMSIYFLHYMVILGTLSLGIHALVPQLLLGAVVPAVLGVVYLAALREARRLWAGLRDPGEPHEDIADA